MGSWDFLLRPNLCRREKDQLEGRRCRRVAHHPFQPLPTIDIHGAHQQSTVDPGAPGRTLTGEVSVGRKVEIAATGLLLFGAVVRIVGFLQNASLSGDEAMLALSIGTRTLSGLLRP